MYKQYDNNSRNNSNNNHTTKHLEPKKCDVKEGATGNQLLLTSHKRSHTPELFLQVPWPWQVTLCEQYALWQLEPKKPVRHKHSCKFFKTIKSETTIST
jgi:hypothetical protein